MIIISNITYATIRRANITTANSSTANSKEDTNPRISFRNGAPIGVSELYYFSIFSSSVIVSLSQAGLFVMIGMILARCDGMLTDEQLQVLGKGLNKTITRRKSGFEIACEGEQKFPPVLCDVKITFDIKSETEETVSIKFVPKAAI